MIKTAAALFPLLDAQDITYINHQHPPTHRFEEHREIRDQIAGIHCKSLFLTDKKNFFMVLMRGELRLDLKGLQNKLESKRLSFGKSKDMEDILGVAPGSCTPYALINDDDHQIKNIIMDNAFSHADYINFHPIENTATIQVSYTNFIKWLTYTGHSSLSVAL